MNDSTPPEHTMPETVVMPINRDLADMSDAEIDLFAAAFYEAIRARLPPSRPS